MKPGLTLLLLFYIFGNVNAQNQSQLLLDAYQSNDLTKLEAFFNQWFSENIPLSAGEMNAANDTVREIYRVFQQFYNPLDIERTGGSEWGNDMYRKAKYFLLQDDIRFALVDTLDKEILLNQEFLRLSKKLHVSVDSVQRAYLANRTMMKYFHFDWPNPDRFSILDGFHPIVAFTYPKMVILTPRYDTVLNQFLGNSHYPLGSGDIMSPAVSSGESANRQKFLGNCIKIWYGHWGGYWQLHTYPYVTDIVFDKSLTHALVNYRMVYEGGYAYFKKVNDSWILVEAQRTWIE